jgi:hypothetical protein
VMGVIRGDWGAAWDGVKAILTGAWDFITAVARGALDILKGVFGAALQAIASVFSSTWQSIKRTVGNAIGAVVDTVTGRLEGIVSFVGGLPGRISSLARGMFDGISGAFRSAVNFIIRAWNGLEFEIPGFDPPGPGSFGGFVLGVPNIPELARGGIVQARAGGMLARLAEGGSDEAVIPLDAKHQGMFGGEAIVKIIAGDRHLAAWLRSMVRAEGGGDVQAALGT